MTGTPFRPLDPGIGVAVGKRTILRTTEGVLETWGDVAYRVAGGNSLMHPSGAADRFELEGMIANASVLLSGRSLQHGDMSQPTRPIEVFTNCSTSAASFLTYYLLLNGSGVGRSYADDLMVVDWDNMPDVLVSIGANHQDYKEGMLTTEEALQQAKLTGKPYSIHWVEDSREGWAKAVEVLEVLAFYRTFADHIIIIDFSKVRPEGAPIMGMQGRPSSGPIPTMETIRRIASVKGRGAKPWLQAMMIDHWISESVLVGGARRAARMSCKPWFDADIFDFINIKQTLALWSSNNSVLVDAQFWAECRTEGTHANLVFNAIAEAAFSHGTGEPGIINVDRLAVNEENLDLLDNPLAFSSSRFVMTGPGMQIIRAVQEALKSHPYKMLTNPCGEITLRATGGYCVISDVVPFHCETLDEAEAAFRAATRALMRINLMPALYNGEVKRTNRIGVGVTGLHEFAWKFFGLGFREMLDLDYSQAFWNTMRRFSNAVKDEARKYAVVLGVTVPHTSVTIKPAGTTSKLFALTEGAHLPAMRQFLRWVQFRQDDPLVAQYEEAGYPIRRDLKTYPGTTIVGFPSIPTITKLGMGSALVLASEATPEEQYRYLGLLEEYFLGEESNQISYTLKYDPKLITLDAYKDLMVEHQSKIKCCSVLPLEDTGAYEYMPEEAVTDEQFAEIIANIKAKGGLGLTEDIDENALRCSSGACPL